MSSKDNASSRRQKQEGLCKQCDCEEFRPSLFAEGLCHCAHRQSKHFMEPHEHERVDMATIEADLEIIKELGQG